MRTTEIQLDLLLPEQPELRNRVQEAILSILRGPVHPSAQELLREIESKVSVKGRWEFKKAITELIRSGSPSVAIRSYLESLLNSGEVDSALRGEGAPDREFVSSIDSLLQLGREYRGSAKFSEMISFMAKFREYKPFNNMLVRIQNPGCSFFATESHWRKKFNALLKEDARPILILAPKHPVLLVYDLDQVEGIDVPDEIEQFANFSGQWNGSWLLRTIDNARRRDQICVDFRPLSSTLAGFATLAPHVAQWKRRIAIHDQLDEPSRFGVLCHELAHIYLGHLGSDADYWWPSRTNLTRNALELEAEAVAFLVTSRLGLQGYSYAYVSRHMPDGNVPSGVSMELIAKVAGRIEQMTKERLPSRAQKRPEQPV